MNGQQLPPVKGTDADVDASAATVRAYRPPNASELAAEALPNYEGRSTTLAPHIRSAVIEALAEAILAELALEGTVHVGQVPEGN